MDTGGGTTHIGEPEDGQHPPRDTANQNRVHLPDGMPGRHLCGNAGVHVDRHLLRSGEDKPIHTHRRYSSIHITHVYIYIKYGYDSEMFIYIHIC